MLDPGERELAQPIQLVFERCKRTAAYVVKDDESSCKTSHEQQEPTHVPQVNQIKDEAHIAVNAWTKCSELRFNPVALRREVFVRSDKEGHDESRQVMSEYFALSSSRLNGAK